MTGLSSDGGDLVDEAFGMKQGMPALAFNLLRTPTEQSEHKGLANLVRGMFGAFRNTTAHAPKISWPMGNLDDALGHTTTLASIAFPPPFLDAAHESASFSYQSNRRCRSGLIDPLIGQVLSASAFKAARGTRASEEVEKRSSSWRTRSTSGRRWSCNPVAPEGVPASTGESKDTSMSVTPASSAI